ncbi:MAG: phosphoribosylglycinamide formyltransferase [Planctomycetia bacterium]|nr:phosphoribosylglycinamide formyltransferase [Planctomycetia bacterium]
MTLHLAVLISGQGRTLKNLLDVIDRGELDATVDIVIASKKDCKGLQYADQKKIPIAVVESHIYETKEEFSAAVFRECRSRAVDYVVMAGYLKFLLVPNDFNDRVLNIHPSLIPSFCGAGMYGRRVHEQVLARGVKVSGATVHFVDNIYDNGPIILQKVVPVLSDDTVDSLSDRVLLEAEFPAYPEALRLISEGRVKIVNHPTTGARTVKILNDAQ